MQLEKNYYRVLEAQKQNLIKENENSLAKEILDDYKNQQVKHKYDLIVTVCLFAYIFLSSLLKTIVNHCLQPSKTKRKMLTVLTGYFVLTRRML